MTTPSQHDLRNAFRKLLASDACYYTASVFDPMSARIAADLDFDDMDLEGDLRDEMTGAAEDLKAITDPGASRKDAEAETAEAPKKRKPGKRKAGKPGKRRDAALGKADG